MSTYFFYNFVVKNVFCQLSIFIYNIALQNTDLGVLQKSSKHFLISIFFPPGEGEGRVPHLARYFGSRTMSRVYLFFLHICSLNMCFIYNSLIKYGSFVCFRSLLTFALVYENSRPLFHKILDPPLPRSSLISSYCFAGKKTLSPGFLGKKISPVWWTKIPSPCLVKKYLPVWWKNKFSTLGENHAPTSPSHIYQLVHPFNTACIVKRKTSYHTCVW